jgi:uncharacterized protein (TIGR00369 family)
MSSTTRISAAALAEEFLRSPCIRHMGLEAVEQLADGAVRARMPLRPEHERGTGTNQFHGGPIAAFIDTVGDLAVGVAVGGGVPTMNLRIDYLKPAMGPWLVATARVRRLGRTVAVADVDVEDAQGALVAIGRGSYVPVAG